MAKNRGRSARCEAEPGQVQQLCEREAGEGGGRDREGPARTPSPGKRRVPVLSNSSIIYLNERMDSKY